MFKPQRYNDGAVVKVIKKDGIGRLIIPEVNCRLFAETGTGDCIFTPDCVPISGGRGAKSEGLGVQIETENGTIDAVIISPIIKVLSNNSARYCQWVDPAVDLAASEAAELASACPEGMDEEVYLREVLKKMRANLAK